MTKQQYFDMLEAIGAEPIDEEIPIEFEDFLEDTQTIISIYNLLPSKWDGFSGSYMGKDYINLELLFNSFHINGEDIKLIAFTILAKLDDVNISRMNKKQEKVTNGGKNTNN